VEVNTNEVTKNSDSFPIKKRKLHDSIAKLSELFQDILGGSFNLVTARNASQQFLKLDL
jgi:hypothetical protein